MKQATETFDLSEVEKALAAWRMTATVTAAHGVDTYRAMLHSSGERLRTGERAAGAVPWSQLKVELGLPG
ncbi:hypothetical protein EV383_1052 [Pseudonocardia sediminis]|uniref:Uncharacterized protein n=2 Tax=Pseudonocardia sediminis TaxID=1397368 RepID=A0A4Q7UT94_PSEST|nr:hypothetical protein EV383_1052 [Pseudonocardia sediminis]